MCMYIYAEYTYINAHTNIYLYIYKYTCIYIYIHTYIHTYIISGIAHQGAHVPIRIAFSTPTLSNSNPGLTSVSHTTAPGLP